MVRGSEDLTREETGLGLEEKRKFLGDTREEWTAGSLSRSMLMKETSPAHVWKWGAAYVRSVRFTAVLVLYVVDTS